MDEDSTLLDSLFEVDDFIDSSQSSQELFTTQQQQPVTDTNEDNAQRNESYHPSMYVCMFVPYVNTIRLLTLQMHNDLIH